MLTLKEKKQAMTLVRMDDTSDRWGTTMDHWFAIADVLYHESCKLIPDKWEYKHSPVCDGAGDLEEWPDSEYFVMLVEHDLTVEQLLYAGKTLDKYAAVLKKASLDY